MPRWWHHQCGLPSVSRTRRVVGVGHSVQGSRCLVSVGCGADQCPSTARNEGQHGGRGVGSERSPSPGVAGVLPDGSGAQDQIGKVPRRLNPMPRRVGVCQWMVQRIGGAVQVLRVDRAAAGAAPHPLRRCIARPDGERPRADDAAVRRNELPASRIIVPGMILQQPPGIQVLSGVGERR